MKNNFGESSKFESLSREKKCHYYKSIVKRHLNDIKEGITHSKNRMEENYYRNRYAVQLSIYAKAMNVQEKYLERCICPPPQILIHKNQ